MTGPEDPIRTPVGDAGSLEELRQSHHSLWRLFHVLLIVMLVLTGSLSLFLLREVTLIRRQIREATQFVANYEQNSLPVMLEFRNKLYEFAKGHPDFMAIFTKYFNPTNTRTAPGMATPLGLAPSASDPSPVRQPVLPAK